MCFSCNLYLYPGQCPPTIHICPLSPSQSLQCVVSSLTCLKADAHRMEVPRMLFKAGKLDELEDYVLCSDDNNLLRWYV